MPLAPEIEPCPTCGSRELAPLDLSPASDRPGDRFEGRSACGRCGLLRVFDFMASHLEQVTIRGARIRDAKLDGVRFGSAALDGALFERCSLRNASFAKPPTLPAPAPAPEPEPTTADAYFIDCDLTGSDWTDRNLSGATFLRCKLSGARGKPKSTDGLFVQACDCDMDTFLAALAGEPPPNKTPRTDDELRLAAKKVPCEICGAAPPEKLDIFRAGLRAIVGAKCPYCTKGRAITFTVDAHPPPPKPSPVHDPAPFPREVIAERVIGRLIAPERPPGTVGELFDALEVALELSAVATNGIGTIVQPEARFGGFPLPRLVASIAARYPFDATREPPLTTLEALRARRLSFFAVVVVARDEISAALAQRFGEPVAIDGARGDRHLSYGPWVYTQRSCVLGWYERLPDWLRAPADDDARRVALRAFTQGVAGAPDLASVAAVASQLPASCGIVHRAQGTSGADAIEVAFVPPIPANVLVDTVHWLRATTKLSSEGWTLHDVGEPFDPEPTKPLKIGAWNVVPRLADHPTGPLTSGTSGLRGVAPLDVVVSMSIQPMRPNPYSIAAAATAARSLAIVAPSPPDYRARILDSIARWHAQDRAMVAALIAEAEAEAAAAAPPPTTLSLAAYSKGAREIVASAQRLADEKKHRLMTVIHILVRLLALPALQEHLVGCGADPEAARTAAELWLKGRPLSEEPSFLSTEAIAMLKRADAAAKGESVSLIHLVSAFVALPRRATLADLDKHGTGTPEEEEARQRIIATGHLDRFVP